jgi:hypothetical protein
VKTQDTSSHPFVAGVIAKREVQPPPTRSSQSSFSKLSSLSQIDFSSINTVYNGLNRINSFYFDRLSLGCFTS